VISSANRFSFMHFHSNFLLLLEYHINQDYVVEIVSVDLAETKENKRDSPFCFKNNILVANGF